MSRLMRCYKNGKSGYKWGTYGKCYLDEEGGKDKARKNRNQMLVPKKKKCKKKKK